MIGQFSHTKNLGNMVSKLALELGHIWAEENMAEVVQVENVETQDCEFISEKMSEAQRKDLCKELEKHVCGKLVDHSIKTSHKGQELWMSYVKNLTFHQAVSKNNYIALERH